MKLIFVNRFFCPDHSANSRLLTSLATALAAQGWDVHVVTSRLRRDDPEAALPPRETREAVRIYRVWTSRLARAWAPARAFDYLTFYPSAAWRLWRLARKGDIIIANTDPPMLSVMAAAIACVRGAGLVNWLQVIFPEIAEALRIRAVQGMVARSFRVIRNWSLKRARANVVLGKRMRQRVLDMLGDTSQVELIPNWECGYTIRPVAREENELRHEWALKDRFVVGYSGSAGRPYDLGIVLDAAERLMATDIVFLWIGAGARQPWLEAEARRRSLDNVMFKACQTRERITESLCVPDVHVLSLRPAMEGLIFPNRFYGILAAGRPAIFVGDLEGDVASELYRHRCGFSVGPKDVGTLASRIRHLSEDAESCRDMGMRARHAFTTLYDEQLAVGRWERLLKNAADAPEA